MKPSTIIIGAGQAAASAALKLRKNDYEGDITIVGEESYFPYQRPPLSKKFLKQEITENELYLRPDDFYAQKDITILANTSVTAIDRTAKTVLTSGQDNLRYNDLIIATGSRPRKLPDSVAHSFENIFYLRTLDDTKSLGSKLGSASRMLIVGGGYIGLEMAAVARELGMEVTVLEMSERILQRVASPTTSDYFRNLHTNRGVKIIEGVGLKDLAGSNQNAEQAILSDGSSIKIDIVVVGIGVIPNDDLAADCNLKTENGFLVDRRCRTNDPSIYAVGDCCVYSYHGTKTRIESVPNAIVQGELAADSICHKANLGYSAIPWFWSDQYDTKLQIAGLNIGYDHTVVRNEETTNSLSIWYFKEGNLISVDAINNAKAFMVGKKLIELELSPPEDALIDNTAALATLIPKK